MRHLYKVVTLLALLLLVIGIYRKSTDLENSELGFDLPVAAATSSSSTRVVPSGTLDAPNSAHSSDTVRSNQVWSQAIDTVLRDDADFPVKVQRMLQLLSQLPPALQAEAAQHLVNFATDAAPNSVIEPLLSTDTDPSAHGVLLLGLLQRADKIRLPILLQVARNREHPKCTDALQYLHFLLESDDPADSAVWEARIEARLNQPAG